MEVDEVMFVPELKVNFLFVSSLEDMEYAVMFEDGQGIICSKGATLDATMSIGIREGVMYRVLRQPLVGSKGILDCRSISETESSGRVASSKTSKSVNWYDITLMDEGNRLSYQSAVEIAGGSSSSEGEGTTATDLMGS
jgi:hypothetical protein